MSKVPNGIAIIIATARCNAEGSNPTRAQLSCLVHEAQGRGTLEGGRSPYTPYFVRNTNVPGKSGYNYSVVASGAIERLPGRPATYRLTAKGRKIANSFLKQQRRAIDELSAALSGR